MSLSNLREVAKQKAVRFFGAHLPVRMKRLVHIASLGAYLKGSTSLDDATMNKLNTVMGLGSNAKALKLPVLLSRVIWDGKIQTHDLKMETPLTVTPEVMAQMKARCMKGTPRWLRYGEDTLIESEVGKLLTMFQSSQEVKSSS